MLPNKLEKKKKPEETRSRFVYVHFQMPSCLSSVLKCAKAMQRQIGRKSVSMWNKAATSLQFTTVSRFCSSYSATRTHIRTHTRIDTHTRTQVNQGPAPWILRMGSPFKETLQARQNAALCASRGARLLGHVLTCWSDGQKEKKKKKKKSLWNIRDAFGLINAFVIFFFVRISG